MYAIRSYYDAGVRTPAVRHGGAEEAEPDEEVARQFLGPEEGVVEGVAAEHLERDERAHGDAEDHQRTLGPAVEPPAQGLEEAHAAFPFGPTPARDSKISGSPP